MAQTATNKALQERVDSLKRTLSSLQAKSNNPTRASAQNARVAAQNISQTSQNRTLELQRDSLQSTYDTPKQPEQPNQLTAQFDAILIQMSKYLDELQKRGQVINPDVKLGPAQLAEFTHQAEAEINPYYSTQLKLARESLLRDVGYSTNEILQQEKAAEVTYNKRQRQLGENFANVGFAQSGLRTQGEQELASDTQTQLDAQRRKLAFNVGDVTRNFAQQYGGQEVPQFDIQNAPEVAGGTFARPVGSRSLYTLDPAIYSGLVGSKQYEQRGAIRSRASQLEDVFRTGKALKQQRQLIF